MGRIRLVQLAVEVVLLMAMAHLFLWFGAGCCLDVVGRYAFDTPVLETWWWALLGAATFPLVWSAALLDLAALLRSPNKRPTPS